MDDIIESGSQPCAVLRMNIRRGPDGSAVRQAYDICAVIPVIEGVGGCVLHTGRYPESPAGSRFDRIELTDPGKTYASLVCLGEAGGALCAEALGMVAPMMAPDAPERSVGGAGPRL